MANSKKPAVKPTFDPKKLSAKDQDYLKLDLDTLVKKYGANKKSIVDRRYSLKKKLNAAGIAIPASTIIKSSVPKTPEPKKVTSPVSSPPAPVVPVTEKKISTSKSSIGQPIELQLNGFLLKLNFIPKKVSVDPDQKAIEIAI